MLLIWLHWNIKHCTTPKLYFSLFENAKNAELHCRIPDIGLGYNTTQTQGDYHRESAGYIHVSHGLKHLREVNQHISPADISSRDLSRHDISNYTGWDPAWLSRPLKQPVLYSRRCWVLCRVQQVAVPEQWTSHSEIQFLQKSIYHTFVSADVKEWVLELGQLRGTREQTLKSI